MRSWRSALSVGSARSVGGGRTLTRRGVVPEQIDVARRTAWCGKVSRFWFFSRCFFSSWECFGCPTRWGRAGLKRRTTRASDAFGGGRECELPAADDSAALQHRLSSLRLGALQLGDGESLVAHRSDGADHHGHALCLHHQDDDGSESLLFHGRYSALCETPGLLQLSFYCAGVATER